jgi:hypothetical protein
MMLTIAATRTESTGSPPLKTRNDSKRGGHSSEFFFLTIKFVRLEMKKFQKSSFHIAERGNGRSKGYGNLGKCYQLRSSEQYNILNIRPT